MQDIQPLITVILPLKNVGEYIVETLRSILETGYRELEIICVDDGSHDDTTAKIRSFNDPRMIIIQNNGTGISAALNTGLDLAKGEFICRCDGDDKYVKSRFHHQLDILNQFPEFGAVCGSFNLIDAHGKVFSESKNGGQQIVIDNPEQYNSLNIHLCTYLIRKQHLEDIRFREWFKNAEDTDFQLRLSEKITVLFDPELTYIYRIHDKSIIHQQKSEIRKFYESTARLFSRQRAERGFDDLQQGSPPALPQSTNNERRTASEHIISHLVGSAWHQHKQGNKRAGVQKILAAIKMAPLNFSLWKGLVAMIVKP